MINICNLRNEEDLEIIAEEYSNYYANSILKEKWTKKSALELFRYFYDKNPDLLFVAYDEEKPIGTIMSLLKPWWNGMNLEDAELFVCEKYKRRGIAKQLIKTLFTYAIEKYDATVLEAHTYEGENGFPYCWYKRLGFETIDDWKIISGDIKEIVHRL